MSMSAEDVLEFLEGREGETLTIPNLWAEGAKVHLAVPGRSVSCRPTTADAIADSISHDELAEELRRAASNARLQWFRAYVVQSFRDGETDLF